MEAGAAMAAARPALPAAGATLPVTRARANSVTRSIAARTFPFCTLRESLRSAGFEPLNHVRCHHRREAGWYQLRYPPFRTCRGSEMSAVFSEDVWEWARRRQQQRFPRTEEPAGQSKRGVGQSK